MSKVQIHATFEENKIQGKIKMSSEHLNYVSAGKDNSEDTLKQLFNEDINPYSIKNYADGTHANADKINFKIALWGEREERGEPLRTFFVYKTNGEQEAKPIGFATVGVNKINTNNIETGIFFNDETLSNDIGKTLASEAVSTIVRTYPEYMKYKGQFENFEDKKFVFYDTSYKPLGEVVQKAGFNNFNNLSQFVEIFGDNTDTNHISARFSENDGQIYDSGRAVDAFYCQLSGFNIEQVEEF